MRSFWPGVWAASLCGVLGCGEPYRPPRIVFDADPIDLGVLDPGESSFTAPFRNVGTITLLVGNVGSTCSCTQAEATLRVEAAGSGTLRGKIKVQGGPGGAKLTVASNDPAGPREIQVKWFGKAAPAIVPDAFDLTMKVGVGLSRRVEVSYPAGDPPDPLEFVSVSGLPDGSKIAQVDNNPVAIRATPGLGASIAVAPSPFVGKATLQIDLSAPTKPGLASFDAKIHFLQRGRAIEIPWKLTVRADEGLRATPRSLLFSASDFDSLRQIRRKVILTSDLTGDRFRVVEKPEYLNVEVESKSLESETCGMLTAAVTTLPPLDSASPRLVLEDSMGRRVAIAIHMSIGP